MVPETVLGIRLNPITPAIYSLLVGTNNAYLTGGVPRESDLRNFVWFCSPQFNPDNPLGSLRWKWLQMWRLKRALWRGANRHNKAERVLANFYRGCLDVHEIIRATFKDGVAPRDDGELTPIAAGLEAQIVDMFAREYQMWPLPRPVRHTPIKQLYQLARCIDRHNLGADAKYYDQDENDVMKRVLLDANMRN